eukprot:s1710_g14.t1
MAVPVRGKDSRLAAKRTPQLSRGLKITRKYKPRWRQRVKVAAHTGQQTDQSTGGVDCALGATPQRQAICDDLNSPVVLAIRVYFHDLDKHSGKRSLRHGMVRKSGCARKC